MGVRIVFTKEGAEALREEEHIYDGNVGLMQAIPGFLNVMANPEEKVNPLTQDRTYSGQRLAMFNMKLIAATFPFEGEKEGT